MQEQDVQAGCSLWHSHLFQRFLTTAQKLCKTLNCAQKEHSHEPGLSGDANLVQDLCCCSPGLLPRHISVERARKRHRIMAAKRTKMLLSPPISQCTGFQVSKVPSVEDVKFFQDYSYNATFICKWVLSVLQQKDRHEHRQRYFVSRSTDRTGCPGPLAPNPFSSLSCRNYFFFCFFLLWKKLYFI